MTEAMTDMKKTTRDAAMISGNYHEAFVVLPDVYTFGGTEVFRKLKRDSSKNPGEKNIIIIPAKYLRELDMMNKGHNHNPGAEDSLKTITEAGDRRIKTHNNSIDLRKYDDELDLLILWDDINTNEREAYSELERKINSNVKTHTQKPTFITKDDFEKTKLNSLDLLVQKPKFLMVDQDVVYKGIINGNEVLREKVHNNDSVDIEIAQEILGEELFINQFIRFKGSDKEYLYARVVADLVRSPNGDIADWKNMRVESLPEKDYSRKIRIGGFETKNILGITPRDMEQFLSMQYGLLNEDVRLFFLCGSQGSGKTLLSYAAAVDQILWFDEESRILRGQENPEKKGGRYEQIVLLKPNNIMGGKSRDIGALPGDLYDKLEDHLAPYMDAHRESILNGSLPFEDMIKHPKFSNKYGEPRKFNGNVAKGYLPPNKEAIMMVYSGFIRGRSLRNTLILLDEAQNFTPYEFKTIVERAGEGCKIVAMGDPAQVDNRDCSVEINGLTYGINHYLSKTYSSLVTLNRNYRSQMSKDASSMKVYGV